jgi:hypothetical protein
MSYMFKNDARLLVESHIVTRLGSLCGSLSKIVDTPVNGRPSLFGIDSVHQMDTSLSQALLVY